MCMKIFANKLKKKKRDYYNCILNFFFFPMNTLLGLTPGDPTQLHSKIISD